MVVLYKNAIRRFLSRYGEEIQIDIVEIGTSDEFDQDYSGSAKSKTIDIIMMNDERKMEHEDLGIVQDSDLSFGTDEDIDIGDRIDRDMDGEIEYVVERVKPIKYRNEDVYYLVGCREA